MSPAAPTAFHPSPPAVNTEARASVLSSGYGPASSQATSREHTAGAPERQAVPPPGGFNIHFEVMLCEPVLCPSLNVHIKTCETQLLKSDPRLRPPTLPPTHLPSHPHPPTCILPSILPHTHQLTHSSTHPHMHPPIHSPPHPPIHPLSHPPIHSLSHFTNWYWAPLVFGTWEQESP